MKLLRRAARYVHGLYTLAGLLLSVGLVLSLIALWALSNLTEEVIEGDTVRIDEGVLNWLNGHATPALDQAALEITALGNTLVILVLVATAVALLVLLQQRAYALLLTLAVAGVAVITPFLKAIFDRPRPQLFEWRVHYQLTSAAYPSGHATMSMVTFLTIAYIIYRLSRVKPPAAFAALLAACIVILIGTSRLYLGVHYPSDVLAGYVVGFVWAVFCALAIEIVARRNQLRAADRERTN
jgi:undecaprenyl-diphosphatase